MKRKPVWKKIIEKKVCLYCGAFILCAGFMALFAGQLAPYPFYEQFPDRILQPPSRAHWLGTDHLGRDLLSRIIYGSRMSMAIGVFTALIAAVFGLFWGVVSGWAGGAADRIMMRLIDIMYSVPTLVLLILVKVVFDSFAQITHPELRALMGTLAALSLVSWASLARIARGQVLQVKENLYVEAARAAGAGSARIIVFYVLPNIMTSVIILLTFQIPANILFESMLSFLGLGASAPLQQLGGFG